MVSHGSWQRRKDCDFSEWSQLKLAYMDADARTFFETTHFIYASAPAKRYESFICQISFVATCEICLSRNWTIPNPRNDWYDSSNESLRPQGLRACQNYYHQTFSSGCLNTKQTISLNRVPKPLPNHNGSPCCEEFSHLGPRPKSSKDRMVVGRNDMAGED